MFALLAGMILAGIVCTPVVGQVTQVQISSGHDPAVGMTAVEYEQHGMALMARKNWTGLIALAGEGIAVYPDDAELYCLRGYAYRKIGRYEDAVNDTTIGIDLDNRPARYANRGYAFLALGRYRDALDDADAAISLNASYPSSYGVKAIALAGLSNISGAEDAVDTGLALDLANPFFWQVKGEILARAGNCSGAREALGISLVIQPDNRDLPWPGYPNAADEFGELNSTCQAVPSGPLPTRSPFPAAAVTGALAIGAYFWKNR